MFRDVFDDLVKVKQRIRDYTEALLARWGYSTSTEEEFQQSRQHLQDNLQINSVVEIMPNANLYMFQQILTDCVASKDGRIGKGDNLRKTEKQPDGSIKVLDP